MDDKSDLVNITKDNNIKPKRIRRSKKETQQKKIIIPSTEDINTYKNAVRVEPIYNSLDDLTNVLLEKIKQNVVNTKQCITLSDSILSTSVCKAEFPFLSFNEKLIIQKIVDVVKNNNFVKSVAINGFTYNRDVVIPVIVIPAANKRGRKPSDKTLKRRARKTSGIKFGSQITFEIEVDNIIYTCKVFRNGKVIIPGIKPNRPINGMFIMLQVIADVFSLTLEKTINWEFLDISMQYYKFKVLNPNYHIKIDVLELLFQKIVKQNNINEINEITEEDKNESSIYTFQEILSFVSYISFLPNKYGITIGLCYKGSKQRKRKYETNIKIYQTGKINITGSQKKIRIEQMRGWLYEFLNNNIHDVVSKSRCDTCQYDLCNKCGTVNSACNVCNYCTRCRQHYLVF